jgi:hypothetical protein
VRSPQYTWRPHVLRANQATLEGRFVDAERHLELARMIAHEHEIPRAQIAVAFARISLANAQGDWTGFTDAVTHVFTASRMAPGLDAWVHARSGRLDDARRILAAGAPQNPTLMNTFGWAEAAILCDDPAAGRLVLDLLRADVVSHPLLMGPTGMVFGVVGSTLGRLLLLCGEPDARAVLEEAVRFARSIGATALARPALDALGAPPPAPPPAREPPTLARLGAGWRLRWRGTDLALPDVKGLRYLEMLLAAPDREIHVHELVGDEAEASDAGEILDATARRAYQARLAELGAALDEAEARHDLGRAARVRAEIDALTDQITAATGLGGRSRRAGSTVERARINVQRRLRDAIARIAAESPALGRCLEAAVQTGVFCRFDGTMFRALGTPP